MRHMAAATRLQLPRFAQSEHFAQQQGHIEPHPADEGLLCNIHKSPKECPPLTPGITQMSEIAFTMLRTKLPQALAAIALDAAAVGIHRLALFFLPFPVARSVLRLAEIRPKPRQLVQPTRLVAMVSLVAD